jgi:hypothetical protein
MVAARDCDDNKSASDEVSVRAGARIGRVSFRVGRGSAGRRHATRQLAQARQQLADVPIGRAERGIEHTFWLRWSSVEVELGPGELKLSRLLVGEEAGQRISTERRDRGERGGLDGRARQGIKDKEAQEIEAAIRF